MHTLLEGYRRFRSEVFPRWEDRFAGLARGQSPKILLITCADSRIEPSLLFQTGPGDLFVCRNAGNVVPPAGEQAGGVAATIEYAVKVLRVEHVVICGHSDCGAVRAAARPEVMKDLAEVRPWVRYVQETQARFAGSLQPSGTDADAQLHDQVCGNVVGQLANLCTQPAVKQGLEAGTLEVHGLYYDIATGVIEQYRPDRRTFEPLDQAGL